MSKMLRETQGGKSVPLTGDLGRGFLEGDC